MPHDRTRGRCWQSVTQSLFLPGWRWWWWWWWWCLRWWWCGSYGWCAYLRMLRIGKYRHMAIPKCDTVKLPPYTYGSFSPGRGKWAKCVIFVFFYALLWPNGLIFLSFPTVLKESFEHGVQWDSLSTVCNEIGQETYCLLKIIFFARKMTHIGLYAL